VAHIDAPRLIKLYITLLNKIVFYTAHHQSHTNFETTQRSMCYLRGWLRWSETLISLPRALREYPVQKA
jgi:hypothetical protein